MSDMDKRPIWMSKDDVDSLEAIERFGQALDEFLVVLATELGLFKLLDWMEDKLTDMRQND